jgi:hypothetical protein
MTGGANNPAGLALRGGRARFAAVLLCAAGLILLNPPARAQAPATPAAPATSNAVGANLNISPKRVTFDRADRTATVYVFNQGTAPATFDIALVDRIMLPDG